MSGVGAILVTGATGLVGHALVRRLARRGDRVRALVRDPERARTILPAEVELVRGDVTDPPSLVPAASGASLVFHSAGLPEQWQRDEQMFDRVNRQGTRNVLEAALAAGVRRVVYTSTMDVFAADPGGPMDETRIDPVPKHSAYEHSKQRAEAEAEAVRARGLEVVYVNPSAVYGPAPVHVTLNTLFLKLMRRQAPMLTPGGMSIAYVDGVADAHVAAAERGRSGERYLVADAHVLVSDLAREICRQAGLPKVPPVAPAWLLRGVAWAGQALGRTFGFTPLITPGQLGFLLWNPRVDATKAIRELGFAPTPLEEGVRRTIEFLRGSDPVPR